MKRLKENSFSAKFHFLNSQENVEEINWSSSELSENETDRFHNLNDIVHTRKRKRKKVLKAGSNLDTLGITIVDVPQEHNKPSCVEKSPIIGAKTKKCRSVISPILNSPTYFPQYAFGETETSPAIIKADLHLQQSPIIVLKHASSSQATIPKKKLFSGEELKNKDTGRRSPILETKTLTKNKIRILDENITIADEKKLYTVPIIDVPNDEKGKSLEPTDIMKYLRIVHLQEQTTQTDGNSCDDSMTMMKTNNTLKLEKAAKVYFDSHFSSDSASQISINESQTPRDAETKSSDEIETISSLTQATKSNNYSLLSIKTETISKSPSVASTESDLNEEENKKPRYKKNGLAYRLNKLLKKQNASTLLWQHERFLAQNSNFIIPKASHIVFRICKINFKYGCYVLETMDENDEKFSIIINIANISNCSLSENAMFKLYEPYSVLECDGNQKLIMNTCKFECITI